MKLKEFKAEKEEKKERRNKRKVIILLPCIMAIMFLIVAIYQSFAIYKLKSVGTVISSSVGVFSHADVKVIGIYIDNIAQPSMTDFPSNKYYHKTECTNGGSGSWNDGTRELNINGITKKTECKVYFETEDPSLLKNAILLDNGTKTEIDAKPTPSFSVGAVSTSVYTTLGSTTTIADVNGKNISYGAQSYYATTNGVYRTYDDAYSNGDNFGKFNSQHDNGGTSYYYRGAIENNFVTFAGFWWRIIRINGDGSIRLIYNGTSAATVDASTQTGTNAFNSSYNYNAYVGLMYGTANSANYKSEHVGSTYNATIANSMMAYLNNWYTNNIANKAQKVIDRVATNQIFCGDRNIANNSSYTGIKAVYTEYGAFVRLVSNKQPSLQCVNKTSAASKSSGVDENADQYGKSGTGNGLLTNPIGLITADEVSMAGGINGYNNGSYWLYTGQAYWTMSPYVFYDSSARVFSVNTSGILYVTGVDFALGVRPVINLKSDTTIELTGTGDPGTATNPYVVKIN